MKTDLQNILERIAIALEKIAVSLEKNRLGNSEIEITTEEEKVYYTNNQIEINREIATPFLIQFLDSKNIQIDSSNTEIETEKVINNLAVSLGNKYNILRELLANIKRNMNKGGDFCLSIKKLSQNDIATICQFANRLHSIAFLEQYNYKKSPYYNIFIKTTTLPIAQRFFSGQWLERFVFVTIKKVANKILYCINNYIDDTNSNINNNCNNYSDNNVETKNSFSYLFNPKITLENGDKFELDCIFEINKKIYWIECKTGDYQQYVAKYSKFAKSLNLEQKNSLLVLTDIFTEQTNILSNLFSMTVLPFSEFENYLFNALCEDFGIKN